MTLTAVRDWLKTFTAAEHYYIGKLDAKQDKSLGVYSRATMGQLPDIALGGLSCTKTAVKQVSILLHWNQNAKETDTAAQALFEQLQTAETIQIGGTQVAFLQLLVPEPVDVGTDDNGVYERVIWVDFYYRRSD